MEKPGIENLRQAILTKSRQFNHTAANVIEKQLTEVQTDGSYWELAKLFGTFMNDASTDDHRRLICVELISKIREYQGQKAKTSDEKTTVIFGTSGWRGVIGEDFTVLNVHKVVRGIIEMMQTDEFLKTTGYTNFTQVQNAGILLLRDNRYMGDVFIDAAMRELAGAGIKIFNAGECPTGVGSAVLTELKAAGSINFTPSHNPMEYAGIKFNPNDGGPADKNLTKIIEAKANKYMAGNTGFEKSIVDLTSFVTKVDAAKIFREFVDAKSTIFNLSKIEKWLNDNKNDFYLVVDNMHGASRGFILKLLGSEIISELEASNSVLFLNTNEDYSFHGVKPEPSAANQAPLIRLLQKSGRKFTLAVALDPDADRIRFADTKMDIDMNRFGAIAYANLLYQDKHGGIASTAPSSDFALEIAKQNNQPVFETAVGFKYFRDVLKNGKVLLAFEESDGISFRDHTLEKCAIAGFLAALDALATQNKNLSDQYNAIQNKYGYFYPDKAGADVKGVSVEEWQEYKNAVLKTLQTGMFKIGDKVQFSDEAKQVNEINIIDGLKLIFSDKSWILLRPSGTEPKFRYYYELVSEKELDTVNNKLDQYKNAAEGILNQARSIVDQQDGS